MMLIFSSLLVLVSAQQDNTYWGSYEITQVGGGSEGNAVKLLKLPENAPSFFEFASFTGPAPVSTAPLFQPTVQQTPAEQQQQLRQQQQVSQQQQLRQQQQVSQQQQLRQQQQQRPVQQQFRQQQQPQQARPQQQSNQQTQRVLQEAREQQAAVQQLQQQAAPQQFLQSNRIEFLPPNGAAAQQIRQQIASGVFNPKPINPLKQRVASQQRPAQVPQRITEQSRTQILRPTQQRSQVQNNNPLEQLRVFAQSKPKKIAQMKPKQRVAPVQRPVQIPQQINLVESAVSAISSGQQQPRFSNFQPSGRGRSQSRPRAPAQQTFRKPAPLPQAPRQSVQSAPQFQGRPIVESAPQGPIVEEVPEFNDYDAGEHKLSRFQQFHLRKKQEATEDSGSVVQTKEAESVEPTQVISLEEPLIEESKQVSQENNINRKKFAVRRKRPRNN